MKPFIQITIETENDAFIKDARFQICSIMNDIRSSILSRDDWKKSFPLFDYNGNKVGWYDYIGDDDED